MSLATDFFKSLNALDLEMRTPAGGREESWGEIKCPDTHAHPFFEASALISYVNLTLLPDILNN